MLHFERWKIIAIVLTCLAGVLFTLPNFFSKETVDSWPSWMPHKQLPLGLDLRGGAHLLLAMDTKELEKDWLNTLRDDTRKTLREAKIGFTGLGIVGNTVQVKRRQAGRSRQGDCRPEEADPADRQRHSRLRRQRPHGGEARAPIRSPSRRPSRACSTASPAPQAPPSRPSTAASTPWARRNRPSCARAPTASWCSSPACRTPSSSRI